MSVEEETVICNRCGEAQPDSEWDGVRIDEETICNSCVEEYYEYCFHCEDYMERGAAVFYTYNGSICENCSSDFFECESCLEIQLSAEMYAGDGYCYDCYDGEDCDCDDCIDSEYGGSVRQYGSRPPLMFVDSGSVDDYNVKGEWYMGVEIEVEGGMSVMSNNISKFPNLWASTDSSLRSNGVEVISHPGTFDAWNDGTMIDWDLWRSIVHENTPKQTDYRTNGIHIHVSRTAFNNVKGKRSAAHLYRFMQFIQRYGEPVRKLAGRESVNYCDWNTDRDCVTRVDEAKAKGYVSVNRHRPINTLNRDTVEIRMFDGRTDPEFILASVQLVHALVEYTRTRTVRSEGTWEGFMRFVGKRCSRYNMLNKRIAEYAERYTDVTLEFLAYNSVKKYRAVTNAAKRKKIISAERERERATRTTNYVSTCDCLWCCHERMNGVPDAL